MQMYKSLQSDLRASDERYQSLVRANQEKEVALEATRASQEASEAARVKAGIKRLVTIRNS